MLTSANNHSQSQEISSYKEPVGWEKEGGFSAKREEESKVKERGAILFKKKKRKEQGTEGKEERKCNKAKIFSF